MLFVKKRTPFGAKKRMRLRHSNKNPGKKARMQLNLHTKNEKKDICSVIHQKKGFYFLGIRFSFSVSK